MLETPTLTAGLALRSRLGDPNAVAAMIASHAALLDGHFELLSGAHTDRFITFSRLANDEAALEAIARWLAPSVAAWMPTAIVAPSTAGVALAWRLGQHLRLRVHLATVGADGRPASLHSDVDLRLERVVLVNDVVTTGDGLVALAGLASARGASIAGAAWFLSRSNVDVAAKIDAPVAALGDLLLETWNEDECPLCVRGLSVNRALDLN